METFSPLLAICTGLITVYRTNSGFAPNQLQTVLFCNLYCYRTDMEKQIGALWSSFYHTDLEKYTNVDLYSEESGYFLQST